MSCDVGGDHDDALSLSLHNFLVDGAVKVSFNLLNEQPPPHWRAKSSVGGAGPGLGRSEFCSLRLHPEPPSLASETGASLMVGAVLVS